MNAASKPEHDHEYLNTKQKKLSPLSPYLDCLHRHRDLGRRCWPRRRWGRWCRHPDVRADPAVHRPAGGRVSTRWGGREAAPGRWSSETPGGHASPPSSSRNTCPTNGGELWHWKQPPLRLCSPLHCSDTWCEKGIWLHRMVLARDYRNNFTGKLCIMNSYRQIVDLYAIVIWRKERLRSWWKWNSYAAEQCWRMICKYSVNKAVVWAAKTGCIHLTRHKERLQQPNWKYNTCNAERCQIDANLCTRALMS